jgi:hypothetical protein
MDPGNKCRDDNPAELGAAAISHDMWLDDQ